MLAKSSLAQCEAPLLGGPALGDPALVKAKVGPSHDVRSEEESFPRPGQ